MGLRIPKNQTIENKYTSGGEYMFASTQNEYKGYYYELNNRTYAGKEFNINNPEIVKIQSDNFNVLLSNASTYVYGVVSGVRISNNMPTSIPLLSNPDVIDRNTPQFYCKKVNSNIIKAIDEETYINIQKNPLYQTTFTGTYNNKTQTPDDAEKQMQGIKIFLGL